MNRMRNATILVMGLKGVATEAIKNIVLAGIGRLIMADGEDVSEEDLGAGFFFRDEDVGRKVGVVLFFVCCLKHSSLEKSVGGTCCAANGASRRSFSVMGS